MRHCFFAFAASLLFAACVFAQGTLITVYYDDDVLDVINPATAAIVSSQPLSVTGETITGFNGLAQDPVTGTLYGVVKVVSGGSRRLCTIDRSTGAVTLVGSLGDNVASIQFTSAGTLYAVTGDGAAVPETLYTVNKATGAMTLAYTLGNGSDGEAIGFDPTNTGVMYHCSGLSTRVFEAVNLTTGVPANIAHNYTEEITCMAWDSNAGAFFTGDIGVNLARLTTTGTWTVIGSLTNTTKGLVVLPTLNPSTTNLALGTTTQGTASTSVSLDLGAFNLFGDATISAPTGVVVSLQPSSAFGPTLNLPPAASGQLAPTTVYVRIQASAPAGPISGDLTITATGADTTLVAFMGQVDPPPAVPEMDVLNGVTAVADGGTNPLGLFQIGTAQTVTYEIQNTGGANLTLTGAPLVLVTAGNNAQNVAVTVPPVTPISPAGSVTFTIGFEAIAAGPFDFTVSIDNNDANENPYNWTATGTGTAPPTPPEIDVARGAVPVSDGGADSVGSAPLGARTLTYTINNIGTGSLAITPPVNISGTTNCTVNVTSQPGASVAPSASTTVVLSVTPAAAGTFSFSVSIDNDDADENPFNFNVTGTATTTPGGNSGGSATGGSDGCAASMVLHPAAGLFALLAIVVLGARSGPRRRTGR